MPKKRLITALAPSQLINVLAVLRYRSEQEQEENEYEDILLIGGLPPNNPRNEEIVNTCFDISTIWNFKDKFQMVDIEADFYSGKSTFQDCIQKLYSLLGTTHIDVIYGIRNWQLFHEVFFSAYPNSEKIAYGDGFGFLDLNSYEVLKPYNPEGYAIMDSVYILQPGVECVQGIFKMFPIHIVPFTYLEDITFEIAYSLPGLQKYCESLSSISSESFSLALTSYISETPYGKSLKAEINFNLSCIIPYVTQNDLVLVKGHPRETQKQSKLVVEELLKYGYNAIHISQFETYPIELFLPFLSIERAITFASSSCISIAAYKQCEVITSFGSKILSLYTKKKNHALLLGTGYLLSILAKQAFNRNFQAISYETRQSFAEQGRLYDYPIRINSGLTSNDLSQFDQSFRNPNAEKMLLVLELDYVKSELRESLRQNDTLPRIIAENSFLQGKVKVLQDELSSVTSSESIPIQSAFLRNKVAITFSWLAHRWKHLKTLLKGSLK